MRAPVFGTERSILPLTVTDGFGHRPPTGELLPANSTAAERLFVRQRQFHVFKSSMFRRVHPNSFAWRGVACASTELQHNKHCRARKY